jgi:hypothetical protein
MGVLEKRNISEEGLERRELIGQAAKVSFCAQRISSSSSALAAKEDGTTPEQCQCTQLSAQTSRPTLSAELSAPSAQPPANNNTEDRNSGAAGDL